MREFSSAGMSGKVGGNTVKEDRAHDWDEDLRRPVATTAGGVLLALSPDGPGLDGRRAGGDRRDRGDTAGAAADHRQRDPYPPAIHLAAGRATRPRGRGELRRHLPAPLPGR